MGFMFFWLIIFSGYPMLTTKVGGLLDGYGAKEAGLQLADKIIRVDAKKVLYWQDITKITRDKNSGDKVLLSVLRGNSVLNFQVKIKDKQFSDVQGKIRRVGLLGISPAGELVTVRHGPIQSFFLGLNETWDLTLLTYKGLWWMLSGKVSMRESVTGPLGIFFVTSKAAKVGLTAVLHLMAILSISLGLFNILPFPVLDGGHIILLGLEKLRGKALSVKTEEIVTRVGLTVLVSLVVLVTYNDILRFFGESISHFFK
jgi:regulator of sigma E protease